MPIFLSCRKKTCGGLFGVDFIAIFASKTIQVK